MIITVGARRYQQLSQAVFNSRVGQRAAGTSYNKRSSGWSQAHHEGVWPPDDFAIDFQAYLGKLAGLVRFNLRFEQRIKRVFPVYAQLLFRIPGCHSLFLMSIA